MLGDTLGDAHNKGDLSGNGLLDTGSGQRRATRIQAVSPWRHELAYACVYVCIRAAAAGAQASAAARAGGFLRDEDGGGSGARVLHGLFHIAEDGETEVLGASLLGVCATHNLGACVGGIVRGAGAARGRDKEQVPYSMACWAWKLQTAELESVSVFFPKGETSQIAHAQRGGTMGQKGGATYVPCFPVKPWNRTLVSLLMRRFSMVEA